MSTPRSTLKIVTYLHRNRERSKSIAEIPGNDGGLLRYIRDYDDNIGSGSYGEVYRLKLENDPTKTILAKKEKPRKNDSSAESKHECKYPEGVNMLLEARNWAKVKGFGGYVGDEKSDKDPHIVIMPDLASKMTLPLKDVRYDSATEFFKLVWNVLNDIDNFHVNNEMVHYDLTENNILFNENNRQVQIVDLAFTRGIGEDVHVAVRHRSSHCGTNSGYFPPELDPSKTENIDTRAQTSHDVYIVGRMLSRLLKHYALDKNQKPLSFLPKIKEEFESICNDMQAPASSRIELYPAILRMAVLTKLNPLVENQELLSRNSSIIKELAQNLLKVLDDNVEQIRPLAKYFDEKNQEAFLKLFGLSRAPSIDETNSTRPRR